MTHRVLYRQSGLPILQNRVYDSAAEARACPTGDMCLVEDAQTGLIRNAAFRPELVTYDSAYQNEQAVSAVFRQHMGRVADLIETHMGRDGLVEIGCGKGAFLDMMAARGIDMLGFDPAYEGDNPKVSKRYFTADVGLSARGLVLRHVLEHIADPVAFLETLAEANGGQGLIYIEVPCLDWIVRHRAWFDIVYEHANYFRLGDFSRMFGRVLHAAHGFGGQYLTVVADLATLRRPRRDAADPVHLPEDFAAGLQSAPAAATPSIVWGGSSKGVVYALLRARAGHPVRRVIDINPVKQGRYLPVTGLRVHAPDGGLAGMPDGSTIHVMNPNYADEIRATAGQRFCYEVMTHD